MSITRRLLNLARDSRLALALTILIGFVAGLLTIGQAWILSRVVDGVFLGAWTLPDVRGLLGLIIVIVILRALLAWGSEVSANFIAVRIKSDLRKRLFDKMLSLGPAYTHAERTGELVNAAVAGVEALDAYFSQYLPQLVLAALVPLSILVVVFPRDPLSGLILLLTAPLIPVFMLLIGRTAEALTRRQWNTLSGLSAHFFDSLQGLRTLKELGRSQDHARSIARASDRFRDVTLGVLRVTFLSALVLELVGTISTALVAVEVGLRLLYGHMTFQPALFLLILAPEFYIPLRMLGLRFHAGMAGTSAAARIFEILDDKTPAPSKGEPVLAQAQVDGAGFPPFLRLSFSNLSYTYPSESDPVLQDVSLEIPAREHLALVGPSGAGKSTLVALLLRFLEPGGGQLRLDDHSSTEFSLESWRAGFAWVPQNPFLFHDTIAYNLRIAKFDASQSELESAARLVHLDAFIQELPDGYETIVGEEGARLSAGQAQRLALARAFLKNAPVLILDEPTSNLDPEQEALLEGALRELMRDRTIISIAHRLNTVFRADRICVLVGGLIVEAGTHPELLAKQGTYADLMKPLLVGFPAPPPEIQISANQPDLPSLANDPNALADDPYPLINQYPTGKTAKESSFRLFQGTLPRLLAFLRGSWGWVALSVLLGALTVGSNVGLMGTAAYLLSAAALHPEIGTLEVAIVGVRFFGLSRGVFRYAERLTTHNVTFRLLARMRLWFYQKLEPLAPARLMQFHAGDLLGRIVSDVDALEDFFVRVVSPPMVALLITLGMGLFFFAIAPVLAWMELASMAMVGICLPLFAGAVSRRTGALLVSQRAGMQSRLVDGIQGLSDLLAFGRDADYARRLLQAGRAYGNTQRRLAALTGLSSGLVLLLVNLGMLGVLVLSIPLVSLGRMPGVLLAVVTLAALAGFEAVMPLPQSAQSFSSTIPAARRLFELVDAEPAVKDQALGGEGQAAGGLLNSAVPTIACKHLNFSYPGNLHPALQDLSFELLPGQRLAIVGPSGAGKSTLANLLLRFWDYSEGQVLLNGLDLHEYPQAEPRRRISFISQRTFFFNDTLRNNLLLANPTASDAEIQKAAQTAQVADFISGLPKGYDTFMGERGLRLSAGERQRLGLARAFLKDAPIFLLDEPTANLDPVTERLILDTIFQQTDGRSLLLITHRLVGLENMDEILVLERGRICERGSQAELLLLGGLYRRLWDSQNRMLLDD